MNILITGCSGFLASYLVDALAIEYKDIALNFAGITEIPGFTSPGMEVYTIDIRDREKIFQTIQAIRPQLTFHLAAIANVGFSWKNPKLTYEVNFIGTSNILEALGLYASGSRVLLMSSAELYGKNDGNPCTEAPPLSQPANPYALSKLAMEMLGDLYSLNQKNSLEIIKLRSFNFTGPGQNQQFMASDFSSQIAQIEKGLREPVIRVGNLTAQRDFSDVRDIARYLSVISRMGESGGIYNMCSGKKYSIEEILDMLLSFSTHPIHKQIDEEKLRPIDVPVLYGDNTRIREKFNLYPAYDIKRTLLDILNDWRKRIEENRS